MDKKAKVFKLPYIGIDTEKFSILYTQSGDYSVIIRCDNPILQYSADQEAYYGFHILYSNIIKILGVGYTIQKQDVLTKKVYKGKDSKDFLSQKYAENFNGRNYTEGTTYLTITKNAKRSAFFKYDEKEFAAFLREIQKVLDLLNSKKLEAYTLNESQIRTFTKRALAFNFSDERFSLNNLKSSDDSVLIDDKIIKSITLVDIDECNLPITTKPYRKMDDLGYPFPVDVLNFLYDVPDYETIIYNQVLSIPNQQAELGKLQAKRRKHVSVPDPANQVSVRDIDALLNDVATNNQMVVYSHFNILVKARKEDISKPINYIESALFNAGIVPSKNAYNQLELFRSNLPGNSGELKNYDKFLTTSDAALCFFFKESLLKNEESDFQVFFSDRQGIPVAIDTCDLPMATNRISSRNMFVLGPSGSGKSFFMNHLIRQYALTGMDIVMVDTGHSYSGLCEYYGGRYITYTEEKPITMNPFRISDKVPNLKNGELNIEKKQSLASLIGLLWKGSEGNLDKVETDVISQCINAYYEDYFNTGGLDPDPRNLSFNSFYEFSLTKIKAIIEQKKISFDLDEYKFILEKFYIGGEYEAILNDVDSSLFEEPFIVFEIDAIKEHKILFPITTIVIMDVFLQKMRHRNNKKALIIEEAWKAIASPMMAGYILYLYKTVRKFDGIATVVTQELEDIIGNTIVKDSILSNSDTICLLDQTKFKDNYDQVAKLLSLNEIEQNKIFTINNLDNKEGRGRFKEVYIKRGATGEVYGVEVSLYEYLAFTTESSEKKALQKYIKRYGGIREGLIRFVDDLQSSKLKLSRFVAKVNKLQLEEVLA